MLRQFLFRIAWAKGDMRIEQPLAVKVDQDLYIVAGRAAYALQFLADIPLRLPPIHQGMARHTINRISRYMSNIPSAHYYIKRYIHTKNETELLGFSASFRGMSADMKGVCLSLLAFYVALDTEIGLVRDDQKPPVTKHDLTRYSGRAAYGIECITAIALPVMPADNRAAHANGVVDGPLRYYLCGVYSMLLE